eukprot:13927083-Ditylum_brightwellii.AAC.1
MGWLMVKWYTNTIVGAICIDLLVVIAASHQPCPIRDTANTGPSTTQNKPLPPKQQQKHNNQLSGASTGTSGTPSSRHHCHHGNAVPLSAAAATVLAPKPGHGTNNAGGP